MTRPCQRGLSFAPNLTIVSTGFSLLCPLLYGLLLCPIAVHAQSSSPLLGKISAPKELPVILEVFAPDSGTELGTYVKGIGDIDKDGFDDVAVSLRPTYRTNIYRGGNPMSAIPFLVLEGGGSITSGDYTGDGWIDIAIERFASDTVLIYLGGPTIDTVADRLLEGHTGGSNNFDAFGSENLASGDIDGDGIHELVVGAYAYPDDLPESPRGKIYVFRGSAAFDVQPTETMEGEGPKVGLARHIAIGDVNGDGFDDIIAIGYNQESPNGYLKFYYLSVYFGNIGLTLQRDMYIDSRNVSGGFVNHVDCFDADGDGIDDILVDKAYVFKGGAVISTSPTYFIGPPWNDSTAFGPYPWVTGGGDYNGDGFPDIIMSPTQYHPYAAPGLFVMLGRPGVLGQFKAYRTWSDCCGIPLSGRPQHAGDVNGDGVDDIITSSSLEPLFKKNGFFGIYSGDTSLVTKVASTGSTDVPVDVRLHQNFPNPFNPSTTIEYSIHLRQVVQLQVLDISGKIVAHLVDTLHEPGSYQTVWDGRDDSGILAASGVYFIRIRAGENQTTKRMMLLR